MATAALVAAAATAGLVAPRGGLLAGGALILAAGAALGVGALRHGRREEAMRAMADRLATCAAERSQERARVDEALAQVARLQQQLVVADRRISVGRLAAGVGHEIANPLAFVAGNLEWLEAELQRARARLDAGSLEPEELGETLAAMTDAVREAHEGAGRLRQIVRQLKTFARGRDDEPATSIPVSEAVEVALEMVRHETKHRARLVRSYAPAPRVTANAGQLAQVFVNLLVNAAQAIGPGAADANEIRIAIGTDRAGWATVAVSDTGSGIPAQVLPRLFEPFFTTKPAGEGTGLGLSISQGIVRALGGEIRAESTPGAGSTFTVRLPPCSPCLDGAGAGRPALTPPPRARRILVVDDEPLVRSTLARLMSGWGEVRTAESGRGALSLLRAGERFDVILCDVLMADLTGVELYRALAPEAPRQAERFVFVTGGGPDDASTQEFLATWPGPCLLKPVNLEELRSIIQERRW